MEYSSKQLQIIGVAEKLFAQKGFSETSVRDISQEADINVSMISYYFGSKEKLIEALFEVRSKDFLARLANLLLNENLTPIQKVNMMIDGVVDRFVEKQCFHNIVVREQHGGNHTPIISDLLRTMKVKNLRAMESIIEEGQQLGCFKKNIDVHMLSTTLFGTINQAISTQPFYRHVNGLENASKEEIDLHIKQNLSTHLKKIFQLMLNQELNEAIGG
jgi:AcrR family transcriptional regulator